ncbi:MAG: hypothetical protein WKG01_20600 [Kofleriaceae bacterium]
MRIQTILTIPLLATLGACVTSEDEAVDLAAEPEILEPGFSEEVGDPNAPEIITYRSEEPASLFGSTVFTGGPGNRTTYLTENASTHTCYLRGISGSLKGQTSSWDDPRVDALVSVEVDSATNKWKVRTKAGYGPGVWAYISCVMNTTNRRFLAKTAGGAGNDEPITDRRRCFLTGITAHGSAMTGPRPNDAMPGVRVWTYGGTWRINTWFSDNTDGSIDGHASAVCIDISGIGETGQHGVENGDLVIFDWGNYNDWYCGAEGIFGWFTGGQDSGAWSYKQNPRWRAKATSGKALTSRCYY